MLQQQLDAVHGFCTANGLRINAGKTKAMYINCQGTLQVAGKPVEAVTSFKYLGIHLHSDLSRSRRCHQYAADRLTASQAAYFRLRGHCLSLGVRSKKIRTLLVESYVTSHLLFASAIWSHSLGSTPVLPTAGPTVPAKLEIHHRRALRWALGLQSDTRNAATYFLAHTIPVQGLAIKQRVRYYAGLEHQQMLHEGWEPPLAQGSLTTGDEAQPPPPPRWIAGAISALTTEYARLPRPPVWPRNGV